MLKFVSKKNTSSPASASCANACSDCPNSSAKTTSVSSVLFNVVDAIILASIFFIGIFELTVLPIIIIAFVMLFTFALIIRIIRFQSEAKLDSIVF